MLDWIEKLPDSVTGFAAAAAVWTGLNYVFIAPRAMERDNASHQLAVCAEAIESKLRFPGIVPRIGEAFGLPQLDQFTRQIVEGMRPRALSIAEKQQRCTCARKRASEKLRFDYAVHTATFRIVSPQSVSTFGDDVVSLALSGVCGVIPALRRE